MDKSRIRILVVDDERTLCSGIQEALRREGYAVDAANDAATAMRLVAERLYNLVLTDIRMPGATGLDLLREGRRRSRDTQFILVTAYGTVESAVEAMKLGAYDYLPKPIDMQRLRSLVARALEFQAVVAENTELRSRLRKRSEPSFLTGTSESIRRVIELVQEIACSEVTILIEGESGTGKELVARAIHAQSDRANQPFISVNCAALPEQLVEAELFGHVKGAFTGAIANKPGRFQLADNGTLFLDEIGDLSAKGQGDLLRVLEDGCFRMVGGSEVNRVNVRLIAATNQRLEEAVRTGKFREDLMYRLQVVPIQLPPLRERREDIPLLVEALLDHFAAKHRRRRKEVTAEAMTILQAFPWPGNVRQLRNLLERLVLTVRETLLDAAQLPDSIRFAAPLEAGVILKPGMTLAEAERRVIRMTLDQVTRNRDEAARVLGISRRALQYKLKAHDLLDRTQTSSGVPGHPTHSPVRRPSAKPPPEGPVSPAGDDDTGNSPVA